MKIKKELMTHETIMVYYNGMAIEFQPLYYTLNELEAFKDELSGITIVDPDVLEFLLVAGVVTIDMENRVKTTVKFDDFYSELCESFNEFHYSELTH